jgi:tetratricopeptide (TPR) repeat protein
MMLRVLLLTLVLLGDAYRAAGQDVTLIQAEEANNLYDSGEYAAAAAIYNTLIASGIHDPAIYANLGHSYLALGDLGRALLNYRRAQNLSPRAAELNNFLARVRAARNTIQGDEIILVDSLAQLTQGIVTESELTAGALLLWFVFFVALSAKFLRSTWPIPIGPLLILLGLILALWGSRLYTTRYRPPGVVTAPIAAVMSGPGETYLKLYDLYAAAELRILETRGEWVRFVLPDQRQGWLPVSSIERVE